MVGYLAGAEHPRVATFSGGGSASVMEGKLDTPLTSEASSVYWVRGMGPKELAPVFLFRLGSAWSSDQLDLRVGLPSIYSLSSNKFFAPRVQQPLPHPEFLCTQPSLLGTMKIV